jgi:hypothetical protein
MHYISLSTEIIDKRSDLITAAFAFAWNIAIFAEIFEKTFL